MADSATPGTVLKVDFKTSKEVTEAGQKYSDYALGYIGREEAVKIRETGYMGDFTKTDAVFSANTDMLSKSQQLLYGDIFDASQEADSPLFRPIFSFDNEYLLKNGIDYTTREGITKIKEIARLGISELIEKSHLESENVIWTGAIHYNTGNIHVHVALVELNKVERRYDKLELEAIDAAKSVVANRIIDDDLKIQLSKIFKADLPKWIGEEVRKTGTQISELLKILPSDIPWMYKKERMAPYRQIIDESTMNVIKSSPKFYETYMKGRYILKQRVQQVREEYGDSTNVKKYDEKTKTWYTTDKRTRGLSEHVEENYLRDFYSRAGNAILKAAKEALKERQLQNHSKKSSFSARLAGEKAETFNRDYPVPVSDDNDFQNVSDFSTQDSGESDARPAGKKVPEEFPFSNNNIPPERDNFDYDAYADYAEQSIESKEGNIGNDTNSEIEAVRFAEDSRGLAGEKSENWRLVHYFEPTDISYLANEVEGNASSDSIKTLSSAAQNGDAYAQYRLGCAYYYANGVNKDSEIAIRLFTASANNGNAYAQDKLGYIYEHGSGTQRDDKLAAYYYYHAYNSFSFINEEKLSGDSKILLKLGDMNEKGRGVPNNIITAVELYKSAANLGNTDAQYRLGIIYLKGREDINGGKIKADPEKAFEFLRTASQSAVQEGKHRITGQASYELAKMYRDGIGTEKDSKEAKALFDVAFYYTRKERQNELCEYYAEWTDEYREARNYLYGTGDIECDLDTAYRFMKAQADGGNAFAIYDLARMSSDGLGTKIDSVQASELYSKAMQAFLHVEPRIPNPKNDNGVNAYKKAYIQYRIGKMYAAGLGTDRDYTLAAEWFKKSVTGGNKFAMYSLAGLYYRGQGVEKNCKTALSLYSSSAEKDNAFAAYEAGKMYRDGIGTDQDNETAKTYFKKAFSGFVDLEKNTKDDKIQYRLGKMLETGTGTEKNVDSAIEYYIKSSQLGNANAQYALAKIYLASGDIDKLTAAVNLLEKSSSNGNSFAQYALGCIYLNGERIEKNIDKAIELLTASALQENDFAQYKLGCLYIDGKDVSPDIENGLQLLTFSAELGNQYAQYRLGCICLDGKLVGKNIDIAVQLLTASTDQKNAYAAYRLGEYYAEKDETLSKKYYTQAFDGFSEMEKENHDAMLQYRLGNMCLKAHGCDQNIGKTFDYLSKSAAQGNQYAQYTLGSMYLNGEYIDKDLGKAIRLLTVSANQNNQNSQYQLGRICLMKGQNKAALDWFRKSAAQGNEYAEKAIDRISHPRMRSMKHSFNSLRTAATINKSVRRLAKDYDRKINSLKREFDYEQDIELEQTRSRSI